MILLLYFPIFSGENIRPNSMVLYLKLLRLGGANVSSANGYHISNAESLELILLPGNSLFGLANSGSKDIAWFEQDI